MGRAALIQVNILGVGIFGTQYILLRSFILIHFQYFLFVCSNLNYGFELVLFSTFKVGVCEGDVSE